MEKVNEVIGQLKEILEKTESVRKPLVEAHTTLRNTICRESQQEWLKGESPRCKREFRMATDASDLAGVRNAIEKLVDNQHLLAELEAAGWDYNKFVKKYE